MILRRKRNVKPLVTVPYTQMHEGTGSSKVWQEFFCRTQRKEDRQEAEKSCDTLFSRKYQPGCGGYFIVGLMVKFSGKVSMRCPQCGHVHTRYVKNGYIQESGRAEFGDSIDLTIMKSAWSQEPRTVKMQKKSDEHRQSPNTWDAAVIQTIKDIVPDAREKDAVGGQIMRESWMNLVFGTSE